MIRAHAIRRGDAGFTVIEVIVAMVILGMIAAASTAVFSSSSRSMTRTKVQERQQSIAAGVLSRAQADSSWTADLTCTAPAKPPCAGSVKDFIAKDDPLLVEAEAGTIGHVVTFDAIGIDKVEDNPGGVDKDGIMPDLYEITITVASTELSTGTSFGTSTAKGVLDMSTRATLGSIRVRSCAVDTQVDERIGTGLCEADRTFTIAPPAGSCATATPECSAWNAARSNPEYTTMPLKRTTGTKFRLFGPLETSPSKQASVEVASVDGTVVPDLEPGTYRLQLDSTRYALWSSHSVPAGGNIVVRAGNQSTVVQLLRPKPVTTRITLEHRDITDPDPSRQPIRSGLVRKAYFKLLPVPAGRSPLASDTAYGGWTYAKTSTPYVDVTNVTPGLYELRVMHYPGTAFDTLVRAGGGALAQQFLWVDASGAVTPTDAAIRQTYCNVAERLAIVKRKIPANHQAAGAYAWTDPVTGVRYAPCEVANLSNGANSTIGSAVA